MNTPRERLENKVQKVLDALDDLAKMSSMGDAISPNDVAKINAAIEEKTRMTMNALSTGRDAVDFKL